MAEPVTHRVRQPPRPERTGSRVFAATVRDVRDLTPHMRRLTIAAEEFSDYAPSGPDEYLGLLLPQDENAALVLPDADQEENIRAAVAAISESSRPDLRWYTLRHHRPAEEEIDIDFVVHGDEGPGTRFANRAMVGSVLGVRECSALYAPLPDVRTRVIFGDESAIPAIARILEMTGTERTNVFIEIADATEQQQLPGNVTWVLRDAERPGVRLQQTAENTDFPATIDYAWVCGERGMVQELRRLLVRRGVPKDRITFSGYWRLGEPRG